MLAIENYHEDPEFRQIVTIPHQELDWLKAKVARASTVLPLWEILRVLLAHLNSNDWLVQTKYSKAVIEHSPAKCVQIAQNLYGGAWYAATHWLEEQEIFKDTFMAKHTTGHWVSCWNRDGNDDWHTDRLPSEGVWGKDPEGLTPAQLMTHRVELLYKIF